MGRTSDASERLITAMADLVHRHGYNAVSVDDVCAAAGVKKGSFYYFFPSKRELMLAALEQRDAMAKSHVMGGVFDPEVPPLERIERLFAAVATFETANKRDNGKVLGCPFGNIAIEMSTAEPKLARRADAALSGIASFIATALKEAKARGEIAKRVDVDEAAEAIVAYFEGAILLAKARNDPSVLRKLGKRAISLV